MIWYQNDSYKLQFELRDPVNFGNLLDFEGIADIIFNVKDNEGNEKMVKKYSLDEIAILGSGRIEVTTGTIDATTFPAGSYHYYIVVQYSNQTITPVRGTLIVLER